MRFRSLIAGAALVATTVAALITPAQSALAQEADGFLRCFHMYVPVTTSGGWRPAGAGIWDWDSGEYVEYHWTFNESNTALDYYFAVSDTQVGFVNSAVGYGSVSANDEYGIFKYASNAEIEEVDWAYCAGSIMDGRLNASDLGALSYIYPDANGYSVWELNLGDMKGYQQFAVTKADIAAAIATAKETGVNQQIGSTERGTTLWVLAGGQCQLNHFELDGKINEFTFDCAV